MGKGVDALSGVFLASLVINEMEWLPRLWNQHKDWPDLEAWVFVEAADRQYAEANPLMVTSKGLSVDGTTQFLENLVEQDSRVLYMPYGFSKGTGPALGKCGARQGYLDVAEHFKPEFVISVDADEFYTREHQQLVLDVMRREKDFDAFIFNRREIWRPPSISHEPLFQYEVVGGFWGIPCCHWWRWQPGMNHNHCHNTPHTKNGVPMNEKLFDGREHEGMPEMIHLGFASQKKTRWAKHEYYSRRGESRDRSRKWYVESRGAWFDHKIGMELPRDAKVVPYTGPIPECFEG